MLRKFFWSLLLAQIFVAHIVDATYRFHNYQQRLSPDTGKDANQSNPTDRKRYVESDIFPEIFPKAPAQRLNSQLAYAPRSETRAMENQGPANGHPMMNPKQKWERHWWNEKRSKRLDLDRKKKKFKSRKIAKRSLRSRQGRKMEVVYVNQGLDEITLPPQPEPVMVEDFTNFYGR